MTKKDAIQKLLTVAKNEIGYLEKKSNSTLNDKTANAGNNNYTKYAADHAKFGTYHASKQGLPWCEQFVDWCFIKAFGFDNGMKMTYQTKSGYGAGCTESFNYYKANKATFSKPEIGDQIYFGESGKMTHTGIVADVDKEYVYTIEGNTSSGTNTVVANGGGVWQKKYSLNNKKIGGYGRPNWSAIMDNQTVYGFSTWKGGRIYTISLSEIERMEHITNPSGNGEYTTNMAKQAVWKGRTPTFLMNAELFNMKTYTPASGVKDNGVEALKGWQYGIGTNDYKTPLWQYGQSVTAKEFVGGYPALISNGQKLDYPQPVGVDGKRTRMAYGFNDKSFFIIYTTQKVSLDELTDKFLSLGAKNAINVDGGGSVSIVAPKHSYAQSRKIRGWWAIWLKETEENASSENVVHVPTKTKTANEATIQKDNSAKNGVKLITTASSLNLRNKNGGIITTLPKGSVCLWYGYFTTNMPNFSGEFYYVSVGGKEGFVSVKYVQKV